MSSCVQGPWSLAIVPVMYPRLAAQNPPVSLKGPCHPARTTIKCSLEAMIFSRPQTAKQIAGAKPSDVALLSSHCNDSLRELPIFVCFVSFLWRIVSWDELTFHRLLRPLSAWKSDCVKSSRESSCSHLAALWCCVPPRSANEARMGKPTTQGCHPTLSSLPAQTSKRDMALTGHSEHRPSRY